MRYKGIIFILMALILSGCGVAYGETGKIIEGKSYSEKTIEIKGKFNFEVSCDVGNIDIYTWKRDEIKFEITKRVSGAYTKELIDKKLENFHIDIDTDDDTVFLKSRYKGEKKDSCSVVVDYTIYMPKSIDYMNCKIGTGKIKLFDDFKGVLNAELDKADIEINRFNGVLNISGDEGNVKISEGRMSGNSKVIKKIGNINIKCEFDIKGDYDISTGLGHIDLLTAADFAGDFETVGELANNEFTQNERKDAIASSSNKQVYNPNSDKKKAKVRLKSELGKISIGKY